MIKFNWFGKRTPPEVVAVEPEAAVKPEVVTELDTQAEQVAPVASVAEQLNLRMITHPFTVNPGAVDKIIRIKERCERLRYALDNEPDMSDARRQALQSELDAKTNALKG